MCGISGLIYDEPRSKEHIERVVNGMCHAQRQRGPDGTNVWTNGRVGLGIVRLAIVGSEVRGKQPITGPNGSQLVFNGELYKPADVARSLGFELAEDESDGYALVRLLELCGIDGLANVSAMFGLALFDPNDDSVLLARDAWGQKPLYMYRIQGGWAFASTLTALRVATGPLRVRRGAMRECLIYKSIGGYASAFEDVQQVPPGAWLRIHRDGSVEKGTWFQAPVPGEAEADSSRVHDLLADAIKMRCSSRYRSAIFLSGGLDSSIVAAVASQQEQIAPPRVFTIGYDVGGWEDEHLLAVRLADELNLEHETLILRGEQVPDLLSETTVELEEPIHDPVVVPTLLLVRAAAQETKVVLTGDGSDEFWGGYSRFDSPPDSIEEYLKRTIVFQPDEVGLATLPPGYVEGIEIPAHGSMPALDRIMRLEVANRMRNYHLARVDKLSMAAGLESRSPFLDLSVTLLANRLYASEKRPNERPKGLLVDAFRRDLPAWLLNRRKQPFTVPIQKWLAGPLLEFAHSHLDSRASITREFADPAPWFDRLKAAPADLPCAMRLWSLLHLEIWYQQFARKMEASQ